MNRLTSLLLIPFFVLGQAVPHTHAGTGVTEPNGHDLRPHVHLNGHTHDHHHPHGHAHPHGQAHSHGHAHSHDDDHNHAALHEQASTGEQAGPNSRLIPPTNHDSDAIYFAASGDCLTRVLASFSGVVDAADSVIMALSWPIAVEARLRACPCGPPDRYATLPIYLLTASFRL